MTAQPIGETDFDSVYYHIFNKSVESRNLFNDKQDYEVFLNYLRDYLSSPDISESAKKTFTVNGRSFVGIPHQPKNYFNKIELLAYSLMPDHFHLVVRQLQNGSVEKLIRSLSTRYVIYYNKRYHRSGTLFGGPYKSMQITDAASLLYLTYFFYHDHNQAGNDLTFSYSSYPEYLGTRNTPWVKSNIILSYFDQYKNIPAKGITDYKSFIDNYNLEKNEKEILNGIILEKLTESSKNPTLPVPKIQASEILKSNSDSEPLYKIFSFSAASMALFVLLFSIGIQNVKYSSTQSADTAAVIPSPSPQVAGLETSDSSNPSLSPTPLVDTQISELSNSQLTPTPQNQESENPVLLSPTPTASPLATPSTDSENVPGEPITTVEVKITDGSPSVNLRRQPTVSSEKVGVAKNGDVFELISKDSGWYQIKLADGSSAFISPKYAVILESNYQQ